MILNIHADKSYLAESKVRFRVGGHYFLDGLPKQGEPIILNGPIQKMCNVLKNFAASAAESEIGGLFINACFGKIT